MEQSDFITNGISKSKEQVLENPDFYRLRTQINGSGSHIGRILILKGIPRRLETQMQAIHT